MRKALASMVVVIFVGLLCTSLVTLFTGSAAGHKVVWHVYPYSYYVS